MGIAVVNLGSSSLKIAIFQNGPLSYGSEPLFSWLLEERANGLYFNAKKLTSSNFKRATESILREILLQYPIAGIGHRVVHGGELFKNPTRIDKRTLNKLQSLSPLAPLHNPLNIWGIEQTLKLLPHVPQVALFDTAFHQTIQEEHYLYAIPKKWLKEGIRRYGFHGISYQSCLEQLSEQGIHFEKIVACHLGSGCSVTAIHKNKSVDTTMGMTPLEGVVMGTRSGSIDPGILLYFLQNHLATPDQIATMLNLNSGLKALAGTSDMRKLLLSPTRQSKLAIQIFCNSVQKAILAMSTSLNGLDALIFTGGIGENASSIRKKICEGLPFNLVKLSSKNNVQNISKSLISLSNSSVKVFVFKSREEVLIAKNVISMIE